MQFIRNEVPRWYFTENEVITYEVHTENIHDFELFIIKNKLKTNYVLYSYIDY